MSGTKSVPRALRIAVIGTGNRARSHLATIRLLADRFELCAVCDVVAERAQEASERVGTPWYTDVDAMISREKPDVVLVTVPPEYHHTVACQAAAAGVHIICETPIAITLTYADRMIEAAERNGVTLEIAENVWRWPVERFKAQIIRSGLLGEVTAVRMYYSSGSYHGISAVRAIVGSRATKAVGLARLTKAPERIRFVDPYFVRGLEPPGTEPPPILSQTNVASWEMGLIEFENGVVASYEFPITGSRRTGWEIHTTAGWITHEGEVVIEKADRRLKIVTETAGDGDQQHIRAVRLYENGEPLPEPVWENPYARYRPKNADDVARIDQLMSIYRSVTEGVRPAYGGLDGRADMEVLIAVRESAKHGGQPVTLPLAGVTEYEKRLHEFYGKV